MGSTLKPYGNPTVTGASPGFSVVTGSNATFDMDGNGILDVQDHWWGNLLMFPRVVGGSCQAVLS